MKRLRKASKMAKDGRAAGARLAQAAPDVLLAAYNNRPYRQSASAKQWSSAWDALQSALGAVTQDPPVQLALHQLDAAHGDALVEYEDSAWHAAWTVASRLGGGR